LATCRAKRGEVREALKLAESMKESPYKGDALRQVSVSLADSGDTKGAVAAAEKIAGDLPSRYLALSAIASARAKAGDRDGAAKLVPKVRALADRAPAERQAFALTALAEAEAAAGMTDAAIKTALKIEDGPASCEALHHVAVTQAERGEVREARRTAAAITDAYFQDGAYKEIVAALIRAKDLPAAEKAAAAIGHPLGHCYALMDVAKAQAAAGRKGDAQKALAEALKLAESLKDLPNVKGLREAALGHWAGARAACGDPEGALAWADKYADPWVRAIARVRVIQVLTGGTRKSD
jgi:tetratricopeptide (TPR) repeat protein